MSDFIPESVAYGLEDGEFNHLALADRVRLLRLMARISESSYRRGRHHGLLESADAGKIEAAEKQRRRSLDKSPMPNGVTLTAVEWLLAEHRVLFHLGLWYDTDNPPSSRRVRSRA